MKVKKAIIPGLDPETSSLPILWTEESNGQTVIYLSPDSPIGELIDLGEIDWKAQAELSPYYKDGLIELPVENKKLTLNPGPGFGDLSHPTTRLMLKLMSEKLENKKVFDLGCGNGVLTLAALLMGAKSAFGVDIDEEALMHARQNAKRNNLQADFLLSCPQYDSDLLLINMILEEQKQALASLKKIPNEVIVSGLLIGQKHFWLERGYRLKAEAKEGHWWAGHLAF